MLNQFFHLETFGLRARPGNSSHATIRGFLAEASRAPGAARHVPEPKPPNVLYGVMPVEVTGHAEWMAYRARDLVGRKLRADAGVLVAGVVTYPVSREIVEAIPAEAELHAAWQTATVRWLVERYKAAVASIVAHVDERFPHLHVVLLPTIRHDDTLDFTYAHCGVSAKRFAWIRDENEPMQNARYRYAMKVEQDAFQNAVSQHFGHARSGPRRKRTPRLEAVRRQELDLEMASIEAAKADLRQREAAFRQEVDRVEATLANATLAGALARLSQAQSDLSAFKRLCADQEAELAILRAHLGSSHAPT